MKSKFFLFIISGRSGSSYLRKLIERDRRIIMLGEMLAGKSDLQQKAIWQDFLHQKIAGTVYKNKLALGFKTKLSDIVDLPYFIEQIKQNSEITIILNRRRNYLKQAISRARMLVLIQNTIEKYGKPHHSPLYQEDIVPIIKVDVDNIYQFTKNFELRDRQIIDFANSLNRQVTTMYYEDFASNPQLAIEKISQAIQIDLQIDNYNVTYKNTNNDLTKAIANYEELRARLENTQYLPMLYQK